MQLGAIWAKEAGECIELAALYTATKIYRHVLCLINVHMYLCTNSDRSQDKWYTSNKEDVGQVEMRLPLVARNTLLKFKWDVIMLY